MSLVRSGYPRDWTAADAPAGRRGRSSSGGFSRFVLAVGIGVGGTLAWQAYGDQARDFLARTYPQLNWLAPRPASAQTAPTTTAAAALRTTDQQLQELTLGLAAMRQRVEQLSQQLAISQDQMTRDLAARMQTTERDILDKIAAAAQPPPRPDVTASRKPSPAPTQLH